MKTLSTLFQICIYLTVMMFLFSLAIHYVSGLGIYDAPANSGMQVITDDAEMFNRTTDIPTTEDNEFGMDALWGLVFTGAGIGGLVIAWMTRSTAILGVFIFSVVFWAAYGNMMGILNIGSYIDANFLFIGTAGMVFIWAGAVSGMLSGSG